MSTTLGSLDEWHDFGSLYSAQIAIGVVLSALTIYRKQLSSNRCFHQEEDERLDDETRILKISDEMESQAEELLDGAGLYCSGSPILSLASYWLECFPGEDVEGLSSKLWLQDDELTTSELLEKAGSYCSMELVAAMMFCFLKKDKPAKTVSERTDFQDPFTNNFPPDIHVHIVSFLHPKDVVTLSCVSKSYNEVVNKRETSKAIWKNLWRRDYAWLVEQWKVGKDALQRAGVGQTWEPDKTFYFMFGQTYLSWIIAGENTADRCLVGLHSNIYDITPFLYTHPGSPDTLMAHSGKDCTRFFEDMGHSNGARRLARSLCVVADLSATSDNEWGVLPTKHTHLSNESPKIADETDLNLHLLLGRKQRKRLGTLQVIRDLLEQERAQVERRVLRRYKSDSNVLGGQVNTYYDPFRREWRIWYTNSDLQNVFAAA
jgi:cytochrome b involved in lipid metabolism